MFARFLPGTRLATYWCAGAIGSAYRTFLLADVPAAAVIVTAWLLTGYAGASHLDLILRGAGRVEHFVGIGLIVIVLAVVLIAWRGGFHREQRPR